jgi:hypothetical protein
MCHTAVPYDVSAVTDPDPDCDRGSSCWNAVCAIADFTSAGKSADIPLPISFMRTLDNLTFRLRGKSDFARQDFDVLRRTGPALACTGLYGIMSYTEASRTGKRRAMALGAGRGDATEIVLRENRVAHKIQHH